MKFETILDAYWVIAREIKLLESILMSGKLHPNELSKFQDIYSLRDRQADAFRARLLKMWEESQNEREWYPLK